MSDQATELRRLATRANRPQPEDAGPRVLAVAGGQPGVGATTLAVKLAVTWAADALRVVLLDGDLSGTAVAGCCGLFAGGDIGDVLLGRRNIHEVLRRGPGGIQVLTGNGSAEARAAVSDRTSQRLLKQLHSLAPHVDWVVADAGSQPSELGARLWCAAERVLLVTSGEPAAIMNTYAQIKAHVRQQVDAGPLDLVVSRADEALARDVHRRIDQSCRRFLGVSVALAGTLPNFGHDHTLLAPAVERLARSVLATPTLPLRSVA
jgi:flagellar biosynthesis protein FlhG